MAFHTFGAMLAYDPASRRGVAGTVAKVADAKTGIPLETFDIDGVPTSVVTNASGYVDYFKVESSVGLVEVTVGHIKLLMVAIELMAAALEAGEVASEAMGLIRVLQERTLAIDAPKNFDANSVDVQAVHMVNQTDNHANMPGPGSWALFSLPQSSTAMQQFAFRYDVSGVQLHARVKTSGGWSSWDRLDAGKSEERLVALESLRPTKSVRLEGGKWVWGLEGATHYVLIDHAGAPAVRATPWPKPHPTKPELDW